MDPVRIVLPFPSTKLSGHAKGGWRAKSAATGSHRGRAIFEARQMRDAVRACLPKRGDIAIIMDFYPRDRRADRVNFPNRMKPYIDGVAEAIGFNDVRCVPAYRYWPPDKANPRVEITLGHIDAEHLMQTGEVRLGRG